MSKFIYFISDIHLGDGSPADDFNQRDALKAFLSRVAEENAHLVLLGDVFELWQADLDRILYHHAPLVRFLLPLAARGGVTYVVGNHDYLPFARFIGASVGGLMIAAEFITPDGEVRALHGHSFDPFNHVDFSLKEIRRPIGERVARMLGYLERYLDPNIDDHLGGLANAVWPKIREILGNPATARGVAENEIADRFGRPDSEFSKEVVDLFRRSSPGMRGYPGDDDTYRRAAMKILRQGPRYVLMGHTHIPEKVVDRAGVYVNTGSWSSRIYPPTYALYTGSDLRLVNALTGKYFQMG